MREIEFSTSVPRTARYFSAHFKIDVFRWFARLPAETYADARSISTASRLRAPPHALVAAADARLPLVYDITDQEAPAFAAGTIEADLAVLTGPSPVARWYAGEFIAGPPAFFARLAGEIEAMWQSYCRNIDLFHHQGDEMLTSAALCRMVAAGVPVLDAGPVAIVGRYFSAPAPSSAETARLVRALLPRPPAVRQGFPRAAPERALRRRAVPPLLSAPSRARRHPQSRAPVRQARARFAATRRPAQ